MKKAIKQHTARELHRRRNEPISQQPGNSAIHMLFPTPRGLGYLH
jgi:hypothetical protein